MHGSDGFGFTTRPGDILANRSLTAPPGQLRRGRPVLISKAPTNGERLITFSFLPFYLSRPGRHPDLGLPHRLQPPAHPGPFGLRPPVLLPPGLFCALLVALEAWPPSLRLGLRPPGPPGPCPVGGRRHRG